MQERPSAMTAGNDWKREQGNGHDDHMYGIDISEPLMVAAHWQVPRYLIVHLLTT
jgi:hypothetical protein